MVRINYDHLLYFYMTAKEGGIARAAEALHLSHPTISGQIRVLERSLGEKLFQRAGRRLAMTEMGRVVYRYAEEIFGLGNEMIDTIRGRPTGGPARVAVGIADVLPKMVVRHLLDPAVRMPEEVRLVCLEDKPARLFADLAAHSLDVVLTDAPIGSESGIRAYNHFLGECGVVILGAAKLARKFHAKFPESLDDAPFLAPAEGAAARRVLDAWFESKKIRPRIVGEFQDSALLKAFAQEGLGLFAAPRVIEEEVCRQYRVRRVGFARGVKERFYAVSVERRLRHPAVIAISEGARRSFFA